MNDSSLITDRYVAVETFSSYYIALLIGLGTFGNGFCIIAYMTSEVKKYGSTRYLIALSMSDLGFVVCMSLTWIKTFNLNWQGLTGVCELSTYLSSVCCFLSGWYVTALSGERCLAVCWPYYARRICSTTRTTVLIILLALSGALVNSPLFYVAKSVPVNEEVEPLKMDQKRLPPQSDQSIRTDQSIIRRSDDGPLSVRRFWDDDDYLMQGSDEMFLRRSSQNMEEVFIKESYQETDQMSFKKPRQEADQMSITGPFQETGGIPEETSQNDDVSIPVETPRNVDVSVPAENGYYCGVNPNSGTVYRAFTTIDTVISFSIPLILTFLLNVAIAYSLCRAARERKNLTTSCDYSVRTRATTFPGKSALTAVSITEEGLSRSVSSKVKPETRRNAMTTVTGRNGGPATRVAGGSTGNGKVVERKITSILVAKCIAYLILNLPSYLHRIVLAFEAPLVNETTEKTVETSVVSNKILEMIVYLLFYTQFSTNFLLYSFNSCVNGTIRLKAESMRARRHAQFV